MKHSKRHHNVTLVFPTSAISKIEKMSGVFRFLANGPCWNLSIVAPDAQPPDFSCVDGIIVTGAPSPAMHQAIEDAQVPTVTIAVDFARSNLLLHVTTDGDTIGREVAETFLRQGIYRSFAFVHPTQPTEFQNYFGGSFRDRIILAGASATTIQDDHLSTLWKLPRPLMVFAATDYIAARTVTAGIDAGLQIPRDLSVLGFLNDTVFCENNSPKISSVELDFEKQGYLAAKALDALMKGKRPDETFSAGIKSIVRRETTPAPSPGDALVRRGIEFIRKRALQSITVNDVVTHLKVSRRLAELRFKEIVNRTILSVIHEEKLEATKKVLETSDETVGGICKACGWKSENYPKKLFLQKFGRQMSTCRSKRDGA